MQIEQRIRRLQEAIQADPQEPQNWMMLGLYGLFGGQYGQTVQVFQKRDELYADGVDLHFSAMVSDLVADNPALLALVANMPVPELETAFDAVTVFAIASARICSGDVGGGRELLRSLIGLPEAVRVRFGKIPHIGKIEQIQDLFFTIGEIEAMIAADAPVWQPEITAVSGLEPPQDPSFLVFSLADQGYFDRFGRAFIEAMRDVAPVHIHVVNGDAERLAPIVAEYDGRVTISMEAFTGENLAPYCANSRFLHVQRLMRLGGPDILCMDIDVERIAGFDRFLNKARKGDVTLFQNGSTVPWLRHWATCIYFRHSVVASRYLEAICALLRHKLSGLKWFFDQAVLLSVHFMIQQEMGEDAVTTLREPDGYRLHDFVIPSGGLQEKLALRKGTGIEG